MLKKLLYKTGDARLLSRLTHLVMQCPSMQTERTEMFNELRNVEGGCGALILDNARDLLSILLGKYVEMYAPEQMDAIWLTAGKFISRMYLRSLNLRKGIG